MYPFSVWVSFLVSATHFYMHILAQTAALFRRPSAAAADCLLLLLRTQELKMSSPI